MGRGRARAGALRYRTLGDPPLRVAHGPTSFSGHPGREWGRDTGPDLCPYLSRRSPGGPLGGSSGLRSPSPPSSGRQSGGSPGSAPPRESRDGGVGSRYSPGAVAEVGRQGRAPLRCGGGQERRRGGIRERSCCGAGGRRPSPRARGSAPPAPPRRAHTLPMWPPAALTPRDPTPGSPTHTNGSSSGRVPPPPEPPPWDWSWPPLPQIPFRPPAHGRLRHSKHLSHLLPGAAEWPGCDSDRGPRSKHLDKSSQPRGFPRIYVASLG